VKLNRYIYAAAFIVTVAFVVWLAIGVTQALGWTAWATVVGSGVAVMLLLWIVAAELAVRDARAAVARIVREELHRDDVDALADSLTADVLAEQTAEEFVAEKLVGYRPGAEQLGIRQGQQAVEVLGERPGRHTLMDDTQQLFTHDELFGDGTHAYNDVTEAFPGRLFPDGE
jgi:hypothetical protein